MSDNVRYVIVDVFARRPLAGNALAVVLDGYAVAPELLQPLAREFNLSETVFVLPPLTEDATVSLRIFTPTVELPVAGHPTVGAVALLAQMGTVRPGSDIIVNLAVGPTRVSVEGTADDPFVRMHQGAVRFAAEPVSPEELAVAVGLSPEQLASQLPVQRASVGVTATIVPLRDEEALAACRPGGLETVAWRDGPTMLYLVAPARGGDDVSYRARMFGGPAVGIIEDPATGAAAGPLAAYLVRHGQLAPDEEVVVEQGAAVGRPSHLHIRSDGVEASVGGRVEPVASGVLHLASSEGTGEAT